ncbi:hypothetical protein RvY_00302 [Ramazzottius varieornatus]|uniref:Uncharacterized protein n=1 Tax=Ramazzottius varieornatus TaxID=947166 RepID=A0A1D1UJP6_RAMVA|nr:hypothetical protein RvY_00302 [Ramazzottius varieornatus]
MASSGHHSRLRAQNSESSVTSLLLRKVSWWEFLVKTCNGLRRHSTVHNEKAPQSQRNFDLRDSVFVDDKSLEAANTTFEVDECNQSARQILPLSPRRKSIFATV